MRRLRPLLVVLLVLWAGAAAAAGFTARGQVMGPDGMPAAGALISDGFAVVATGADGRFSLVTSPGRVIALCAPPGMRPAGSWHWPAADLAGGQRVMRLLTYQPGPQAPLALLADPHLFGPDAPTARRPPAPPDWPLAFWSHLATALARGAPALTVVAGDLSYDADRGPRARARAQLDLAAEAAALLPRPARVLPGNHDLDPGGGLETWREKLGPARQVFLLPQMAVIMLDWGLEPGAEAWARRALAALPPGLPVLLVSHLPILGCQSRPDPGPGAALVAEVMRSHRLLAVVHGHWHSGYETRLELAGHGLLLWGLPAVCGGWWRGPREWGGLEFAPGMALARMQDGALLRRVVRFDPRPGHAKGARTGEPDAWGGGFRDRAGR